MPSCLPTTSLGHDSPQACPRVRRETRAAGPLQFVCATQALEWCTPRRSEVVTAVAKKNFSIVFVSFAECGSQTVAEYARIGRAKAFYAVSLVFLFPIFRFLLRKPSVLFALLVMVSICSPQFRLSCMFMPRYFAVLTFCRLCPCRRYDGTIFFFFRVALNV